MNQRVKLQVNSELSDVPRLSGIMLQEAVIDAANLQSLLEQISNHLKHVSLSSVEDLNAEPGNQAIRIIKFEFNMTAQTYIPQPIVSKKAVLKTKVDFVDGLSEETITAVLARIEASVKELEC